MRTIFTLSLLIVSTIALSQSAIYDFRQIEYGNHIPASINSQRTAVVVSAPRVKDSFLIEGDWKEIAEKSHPAFVKMGIDVVFYLNHQDLLSGRFLREAYATTLKRRGIKNIIFLSQGKNGYELILCPFSADAFFIADNTKAYKLQRNELKSALFSLGKEIRRANLAYKNFLIPEKASFLSGISIIEKLQLKNYPGQLRRSKLAVERFAKLDEPKNASAEVLAAIGQYNSQVDQKNEELEKIMESYPHEYVIIDPMSHEDLLRKRHQFVLRSFTGAGESLRGALGYKINESETDYASLVPIMPDASRVKTIPRNGIVTKFYVKQNIAKNIHVGKWDADESWQQALNNFIGNMIQSFNRVKR